MRRPRIPARFPIPAIIALLFACSCATSPRTPSWVLQTPAPDGSNTYFVGSAAGPDMASATSDATANLIAGIMQYMGVSVKVSTDAVARATLDSYSAEIRQSVETQSENRLSGFQVKQRDARSDPKTRRVTVHILAAYSTVELNKEKLRISELFQEKIDAVARPEAEADSLAAEGRGVEAVRRYIDAMAAASDSGIENAELKLERIANKARSVLSGMRFLLPGGPEYRANLGSTLATPFAVRLVSGTDLAGQVGVAGASLSVVYPRKQPNGRMGTRTVNATTDSRGGISLALPAPDFAGRAKITVQLDLSSSFDVLDGIGAKHASIVSALEDDIRSIFVDVTYLVLSAARTIATGIFVVDTDEAGRLSRGDAMQSGILEILGREGFALRVMPIDPALAASMSDDRVLGAARQSAQAGYERFVYGVAKLDSVRKEGGFYIVSVSGRVKAVELSTGRILYSADKSWQSLGSDEPTARRVALRELGSRIFGPDLAASLP